MYIRLIFLMEINLWTTLAYSIVFKNNDNLFVVFKIYDKKNILIAIIRNLNYLTF